MMVTCVQVQVRFRDQVITTYYKNGQAGVPLSQRTLLSRSLQPEENPRPLRHTGHLACCLLAFLNSERIHWFPGGRTPTSTCITIQP